jgi:hypothetical protein
MLQEQALGGTDYGFSRSAMPGVRDGRLRALTILHTTPPVAAFVH